MKYNLSEISPYYYQQVENLLSFDIFQKLNIYMHYYITQITLKYNCNYVDKGTKGWGESDKQSGNIGYYYLWKNIPIKTFEEFWSRDNVRVVDHGKRWEGNYAQRYTVNLFGAFEWYNKFKNELAGI